MPKPEFADDIEAVIDDLSGQRHLSRSEVIESGLREWMQMRGLLTDRNGDKSSQKTVAGKPDPEFVQYPGYFDGTGSL